MKERKYSLEALRPFFLFRKLLGLHEMPLFVADSTCSRSSRKFSADSGPRLLEDVLYLFQSIKSRHFLVARSSSCLGDLRCSCCTLGKSARLIFIVGLECASRLVFELRLGVSSATVITILIVFVVLIILVLSCSRIFFIILELLTFLLSFALLLKIVHVVAMNSIFFIF